MVFSCCVFLAFLLTTNSSAVGHPGELKLIVKPDKDVYRLGEIIDINISLKNTGADTLKLYHPGLKDWGWYDLDLTVTVTRPDSREIVIQHEMCYSMIPVPKLEDFRTIEPEGELLIPMRFDSLKGSSYPKRNIWVGLIKISEQEYNDTSMDDLKNKYSIEGETYYISGKYEYLALREILKDVFDIEGRYVLNFRYENDKGYYLAPDEENKYMKAVEIPSAWTGELSENITIDISK